MFENIINRFVDETHARLIAETNINTIFYLMSLKKGKSIEIGNKHSYWYENNVSAQDKLIINENIEKYPDILDGFILNFKFIAPKGIMFEIKQLNDKCIFESTDATMHRLRNANLENYSQMLQKTNDKIVDETQDCCLKNIINKRSELKTSDAFSLMPDNFLVNGYLSFSLNEILKLDVYNGSKFFNQLCMTIYKCSIRSKLNFVIVNSFESAKKFSYINKRLKTIQLERKKDIWSM